MLCLGIVLLVPYGTLSQPLIADRSQKTSQFSVSRSLNAECWSLSGHAFCLWRHSLVNPSTLTRGSFVQFLTLFRVVEAVVLVQGGAGTLEHLPAPVLCILTKAV